MGKFNKGLLFGGLLGAGMVWLGTTKKGREMREKMIDYAADVYVEVKKKIVASEQWQTMTKSAYVQMVKDAVDKYAVQNGLAESIKQMVVKLVSAQWANLKKEMGKSGNKKK